ncbi:hypothetical protein KCP78_18210 [Salmonella enterica subsp. enterica]|nr:hypothetical protein KCP78_18210 [Salmonella enterica subsp. enterica]
MNATVRSSAACRNETSHRKRWQSAIHRAATRKTDHSLTRHAAGANNGKTPPLPPSILRHDLSDELPACGEKTPR